MKVKSIDEIIIIIIICCKNSAATCKTIENATGTSQKLIVAYPWKSMQNEVRSSHTLCSVEKCHPFIFVISSSDFAHFGTNIPGVLKQTHFA